MVSVSLIYLSFLWSLALRIVATFKIKSYYVFIIFVLHKYYRLESSSTSFLLVLIIMPVHLGIYWKCLHILYIRAYMCRYIYKCIIIYTSKIFSTVEKTYQWIGKNHHDPSISVNLCTIGWCSPPRFVETVDFLPQLMNIFLSRTKINL